MEGVVAHGGAGSQISFSASKKKQKKASLY